MFIVAACHGLKGIASGMTWPNAKNGSTKSVKT